MIFSFPFAFGINTFSMTGFMILLGICGRSSQAADFGIVHGATAALFFAFSANARNLILNIESKINIESLINSRLILILPLSFISFILSVSVPDVSWTIAILLIIRRCTEWLSELHLSYLESKRSSGFANLFSTVQVVLFVFAFVWMLLFNKIYWVGLLLWASAPLFLHIKFLYKNITQNIDISNIYHFFLPHLGSTAIIGISVYIFRIIVLLLAGKNLAGNLYAAYAIGGFVSSVFVYALGPTLVFNYGRQNKSNFPAWFKVIMAGFIFFGTIIWLLSQNENSLFFSSSGSQIFWAATGLSMIGGTIMILGQKIRIQILQLYGKDDVFGPDLMINILILAYVPFSFYLLGKDIFQYLFLINSFITLAYYIFANLRKSNKLISVSRSESTQKYLYPIAFFLIFPIFFQLRGNIFYYPNYLFDTEGLLTRLPIPISVFACFGGLLLISNYKRSRDALYMIFFIFILMITSTLITTQNQTADQRDKFILMMQFLLPMFALILGKTFETNELSIIHDKIFEKSSLIVIATIIPIQIYSTWLMGLPILSPSIFFFSIYQQLQYVPTIFICIYILMLFSLAEKKVYLVILVCLTPIIGIYTALSLSMATALAMISGLFFFCGFKLLTSADLRPVALLLIATLTFFLTIWNFRHSEYILVKWQFEKSNTAQNNVEAKSNVQHRIDIWKYYFNGLLGNYKSILLGNPKRPERKKYPSAHNYYLDLAYNFGIISLIPILFLLARTFKKIYELQTQIYKNQSLTGLIFVVLFLLLVDNSLKVGMRQPYPGIITFFLWGLLLSRLQRYDRVRTSEGS